MLAGRKTEKTKTGRWQRRKVWNELPFTKPVEGIFIGWRNAYEGTVTWIDDEVGNVFEPESHFEVWLIVTNPHRNPIRCRPDQVRFKK